MYTGSLSTALKAEQDIMCGNVCINGAHYSIELPHGGKNLNNCFEKQVCQSNHMSFIHPLVTKN